VSVVLPDPLVKYALDRVIGDRAPAYMCVARDGTIVAWGGDWEAYGIVGLESGALAADRVGFLAGSLPLGEDAIVMQCVALSNARAADVHLVPDDDGDWVFLLDASEWARYQRIGQQAANELALLREAYEKLVRAGDPSA
jgi:hypothetical protein